MEPTSPMYFCAKFIRSSSPVLPTLNIPAGNQNSPRAFMTFQKISCQLFLHHLLPGEARWTDHLPAGGDGNLSELA